MRVLPVAGGLLVALTIVATVASAGMDLAQPAAITPLLSAASAHEAPAAAAAPGLGQPVQPADFARLSPSSVPALTGPLNIVERAAAMSAQTAPVSQEAVRLIAVEQQLDATVRGTLPNPWTLARNLPPFPELPTASAAPQPLTLGLLPATARAAVVATSALSLLGLAALPRLPILPLYSRIEREEAMLNARRAQLYELVRAEPGIHLSDLIRRSGLGWGAAMYHLGVLEKNRVLVAHAEGGFKRYFANGQHHKEDQQRFAALRHVTAKALFEAVQSLPGRSGRELASALGLSPSTLARASERLEEAGLVRRVRSGRRVLYYPAEPETPGLPVAAAA